MTVVELLKKDFQEVFPTIIGEGENKLSIDDIMETSHDYIMKELHNLKEGVNPDEKAELISFLKLMEVAEMDIECDSHIHYKLKRLSEKYPDHKSFKFFLYRYIMSTSFENEEYSLENLNRLFENMLEDEKLMKITDFINLSGLGNLIITLNQVSDELVTLFKDAIIRYPQKITLLWFTAHLYRVQENLQEAIRYNKLFLEKLESIRNSNSKEEKDIDYVDDDSEQMVCFILADTYFDIGDNANALNYCNRVLDHDRDKDSSSFYYFDTLIIRIRIHIISNDKSAFRKDYDELLKTVSEEEMKGNYSDIIDYSKHMKL